MPCGTSLLSRPSKPHSLSIPHGGGSIYHSSEETRRVAVSFIRVPLLSCADVGEVAQASPECPELSS